MAEDYIAMKTITTAALTVAVLAGTASGSEAKAPNICGPAWSARAKVIHRFGKRAPGRNVCRWGVLHRHTVRDATTGEKRDYLRTLRRLLRPAPAMLVSTAVPPQNQPAGTLSPGVAPGGTLASIAQCESNGNYSTNTGNGFYGAYQFTASSWAAVGGRGNPAAASPAEQDRRAAMLYRLQGPGAWPVCSR